MKHFWRRYSYKKGEAWGSLDGSDIKHIYLNFHSVTRVLIELFKKDSVEKNGGNQTSGWQERKRSEKQAKDVVRKQKIKFKKREKTNRRRARLGSLYLALCVCECVCFCVCVRDCAAN